MKFRSGILCAVVALASVSSACTAGGDEESTEDALVSFPAAVFTNARAIAYGQTLQNLPFRASDKYLAVKFQGTKGDRIVGTVTPAGSTKSIVHLARKQGATFVSVKAGGVDAASPNIVLHTLPDTGTYYLVFRTNPTTDGVFAAVNLERLGPASGKCADAGTTPSLQTLVASVPDGMTPTQSSVLRAKISRRSCTTATGCGAVSKTFAYELGRTSYTAMPQGASWNVVTKSSASAAQPRVVISATGDVGGTIEFGDRTPLAEAENRLATQISLPIRGSIGPTCASLDESYVRIPEGNGYVEYRIEPVAPNAITWPRNVHLPAAALPQVTPLDVLSDEEVLSLFPRNGQTLNLEQKLYRNAMRDGGVYRQCHPLTSCGAAKSLAEYPQVSPCQKFASSFIGPYWLDVKSAKVTGESQYSLVTERGTFPVSDGIAAFSPTTGLRLGANSVQVYEPPQKYVDPTYKWYLETGGGTCTFPFTWPPPP